ncbi:unnamed protein product, partial [Urochloa humidicola]
YLFLPSPISSLLSLISPLSMVQGSELLCARGAADGGSVRGRFPRLQARGPPPAGAAADSLPASAQLRAQLRGRGDGRRAEPILAAADARGGRLPGHQAVTGWGEAGRRHHHQIWGRK